MLRSASSLGYSLRHGNDGPDDGILASYQHTNGYMLNGKIQAGKWQESVLGIDGFRLDEAKGLPPSVSAAWANARPGLNYAEVYDGDPGTLGSFVEHTGMAVLDFTRHFAYQAVSQGAPLSTLVGNGFCFHDPDHAYIYVESNDTDGPYGIVNNKLWFYLDAITMPCKGALIFAKDCEVYGLASLIQNMMWIRTTFAIGKLAWEYVDETLLCWSRDGDGGSSWSGGLFCGYSSDPIRHRSEWVHTPFGPNRHLHDYTGHGADVWTNQDGWGFFTFGPNVFGSAQNYVAYAPSGTEYQIPIQPKGRKGTGRFTDFSSITCFDSKSSELLLQQTHERSSRISDKTFQWGDPMKSSLLVLTLLGSAVPMLGQQTSMQPLDYTLAESGADRVERQRNQIDAAVCEGQGPVADNGGPGRWRCPGYGSSTTDATRRADRSRHRP